MEELSTIIRKGIEKGANEETFAYWMHEAADWYAAAEEAWKLCNKEWLYVCCAKTAALILTKVLEHPDLKSELTPDQIGTLQKVSRSIPVN